MTPRAPAEERAQWIARLEASLPPRHEILPRNAAITAAYARWYLEHPSILKWSGMAVSASYEAGLYLRELHGDGAVARALPASFRASQAALVKETNDIAFEETAWAHLAFLAPDGGIDAIERALGADPAFEGMLAGFRLLHAAQSERVTSRAEDLAWEGTRRILEHEQRTTVQRFFARYHPLFGAFVSIVSAADFRLGAPDITQPTRPVFIPFMLRRRAAALRASGSRWPSITRFEHRWAWLDGEVLPCWRSVESARQPALLARMAALVAAGPVTK